jgi:hypothetical protein
MPALWEQKYLAGVDGSVKRKKLHFNTFNRLKKLIFLTENVNKQKSSATPKKTVHYKRDLPDVLSQK